MVSEEIEMAYSVSQDAVLPPPVSERRAWRLPLLCSQLTRVWRTWTLFCVMIKISTCRHISERCTYGRAVRVCAGVIAVEVLVD